MYLECSPGTASAQSLSASWHIPQANLRFRLERDFAYADLPDVSLLSLDRQAPSADSGGIRAYQPGSPSTFRLRDRLYTQGIAQTSPGRLVYAVRPDYDRFVARLGLDDRTGEGTTIRCAVYADQLSLFQSDPLTVKDPPLDINVAVPAGSERLILATEVIERPGRFQVDWINLGFLQRQKNPPAGLVYLYPPVDDPADWDIVAVSGSARLNSRVIWSAPGDPWEVLFDSSQGRLTYYLYLVPRTSRREDVHLWQPRGGLLLETRISNVMQPKKHTLAEVLKLWYDQSQPVGRGFVDNLHHGFSPHQVAIQDGLQPAAPAGLGLYHFQGYFAVDQPGEYAFATASEGGSFLSVDDTLLVSWPGEHGYHGGIRGEHQASLTLRPGVHTIGYLNYHPWGRMFCLAAWRRPGDVLRPLTRADFIDLARYRAVQVARKPAADCPAAFSWQITGDLRVDTYGRGLVAMRFSVVPPEPGGAYRYRWTFDDGDRAAGPQVDHVFLRPGLRPVTLELWRDEHSLGQVTQMVHVHPDWRIVQGKQDPQLFTQALSAKNPAGAPLADWVYVFLIARELQRPDWERLSVQALLGRLEDLAAESRYTDFCQTLVEMLPSADYQEYTAALELNTALQHNEQLSRTDRLRAGLDRAELLLYAQGKPEDALAVLQPLGRESIPEADLSSRRICLHAESLIALGQLDAARQFLDRHCPNPAAKTGEADTIRRLAALRRARSLAEATDDPDQWHQARAQIDSILREDPRSLFWVPLHLVRLRLHLTCREYRLALHQAERLLQLEPAESSLPEILAGRIEAWIGLNQPDKARAALATLRERFPYDPAVSRLEVRIAPLDRRGR
ncbi:MAG: NPCBM/NEW2 domain-containing protein [Sedimentisphaerales bacterium]|nr:NPCBM/NEW2 domain-containing protein [Sedimentisphaerales bacterium]